MKELMMSPYPITEEVLKEEIGIEKPGHRFRIMGKLLHDANMTDLSVFEKPGCEICVIL